MITVSSILIAASIILVVAGIPMAFSNQERLRIQKRVVTELPPRTAYTGSTEALKTAQRRGYIALAAGVGLFILWLIVFGIH